MATTSTSTSSSSSTAAALVSKGEVDVGDFLLPVGSLKVDDRFLFLLLALFFILLLVDRGLLPLGINVGALSGLPDVELGSIFLGLLSLPLVQGVGLGLLGLLLLLLHGTVLLGLGVLTVRVLLDRGVVGLLPVGLLHVILEVAPVTLPPPPLLSSALIPVLLSPDFLSNSLFPPRPPGPPRPRSPPGPPRPRPRPPPRLSPSS